MRRFDPRARLRGLAGSFRDRHGRRARALASVLDGDDDEVTVNTWQCRRPLPVVVAAALSRGLEPVGGVTALVQRGPWLEPMRFTRAESSG